MWLGMKCIGYVSYNSAEQIVTLEPKSPQEDLTIVTWEASSHSLKQDRQSTKSHLSHQHYECLLLFSISNLVISSTHFIFHVFGTHLMGRWCGWYQSWSGTSGSRWKLTLTVYCEILEPLFFLDYSTNMYPRETMLHTRLLNHLCELFQNDFYF